MNIDPELIELTAVVFRQEKIKITFLSKGKYYCRREKTPTPAYETYPAIFRPGVSRKPCYVREQVVHDQATHSLRPSLPLFDDLGIGLTQRCASLNEPFEAKFSVSVSMSILKHSVLCTVRNIK